MEPQQTQTAYSHFALVLGVSDMDTSVRFYRDQLGFRVTFEWNDPVDYAVLKHGESISIHLTRRDFPSLGVPAQNIAYIFVHDIDAVYQDFLGKGVPIHEPLQSWDYKMREFSIKDPDGYVIAFGKEVS